MKKFILFLLFVILPEFAFSKSQMSPDAVIFRDMAMDILLDFLEEGKDPPKSWNDISFVQKIKSHMSELNTYNAEIINSLALVPGSPIIIRSPGTPQRAENKKIFALTRNSSPHKENKNPGRYVFLINADNSDIIIDWLNENEIKSILKQIPNFAPDRQPYAFEDLEEKNGEGKDQKDFKLDSNRERQDLSGLINFFNYSKYRFWLWPVGILIGILLISVARKFAKK